MRMSLRDNRKSIIRSFTEILMVTLLVAAGTVFLVSSIVSSSNANAQLRANADEKLAELQEILKNALWNFDEKEVFAIGRAYSENDFISNITIKDSAGVIIYSNFKDESEPLFVREGVIFHEDHIVGQVRFTVSGQYLQALERNFLWSYFATVGVLLLVSLSVAGAVLRSLLRKAFSDFADLAERYSDGDEEAFDDGSPYVEFDPLIHELKTMNAAVMSHMDRLEESEARLDGFFANAPVGMAILDERLRCLKANDLLADWTGMAPDEYMGRTLAELFPDSRLADGSDPQLLLADRQAIRELELVTTSPSCPDEQSTWLVSKIPVRDAGGIPVSFGIVVMDITERKRAEEELARLNRDLELRVQEKIREAREAYRFNEQVISTSPVGISLYDTTGQCIIANDAVGEMIGATREQVLAQNWRNIKSWQLNGLKEAAEAALAEGVRKRLEVSLVTSFGKSVHLDCYFVPVQREGEVNLMFVVADFSERKRAEDELRSMQSELLRKERLAVLGQLTGTVAHELRNPLGALVASMSVIRHKCIAAGLDLAAAMDRSERSVKRCERIITELLDFARGRGVQLEARGVDGWLSGVVEEQVIPQGITVKTDLRAAGAAVRFDSDELRRALINLVDNACQAMADGAGRNGEAVAGELTVTSRVNEGRVEIEVKDTGPGIPEEIMPHVLEPLFSTKSFGTGLGMPTVQRIMEEHGGGMDISSEAGKGARVTLWLPMDEAMEAKQAG